MDIEKVKKDFIDSNYNEPCLDYIITTLIPDKVDDLLMDGSDVPEAKSLPIITGMLGNLTFQELVDLDLAKWNDIFEWHITQQVNS